MNKNYFPNIIGLKDAKKHLTFLIESQRRTGFLNNLLFTARFGSGKTTLCRCIARAITAKGGGRRRIIEIHNCATLTNLDDFMNQIIVPYVSGENESVLFLNEIDLASEKVLEYLLTLIEYDAGTKRSNFTWNGNERFINFKHGATILATTTNPERLSKPFLNRFYRISLPEYKAEELGEMIRLYCPHIIFKGNVMREIIQSCRGNPRHISQRLSNNITNYILHRGGNNKIFTSDDWKKLRIIVDIRPKSVTDEEYFLLKALMDSPLSLTNISSRMNLDPSTIRRDVESFLVSEAYIGIESKRYITTRGMELLKEIQEWEMNKQN
jgi:Holliday junction resolvasome RuvABC ATP-dependent DNA helicase subunit